MQFRLFRHDSVDSTSERAFAALDCGEARHGDAHLARSQTRGRGRLGRRWESPSDEGLYLSVVLLPTPPGPSAPGLSMAAGLALADAVAALGPLRPRLDWPNDLVLDGAKLAGILIESRGLDPARPHYVVGLGLNVRQRAFPPELAAERAVTSLALAGVEATVERAAEAVLEALGARLELLARSPERIAADYAAGLGLVGAAVEARAGGGRWEGRLTALSIDGGLALELPGGRAARLPLESVQSLSRR